jgi:hypothetical protein
MPTDQDYAELYQQYQYLHAITSILIEHEGGVVEINREILEDYDLSGTLRIGKNDARDVYTVEVVPMEVTDGNA